MQFIDKINPWKAVDKKPFIEGGLALEKLDRLHQYISLKQGNLTCSALFSRENNKEISLELILKGKLQLWCQKCLEPYEYLFENKVKLKIIPKMIIENVDGEDIDYDYIISYGEELSLYNIITDEVIVNLPTLMQHESNSCENNLIEKFSYQEQDDLSKNPFLVLEKLKKDLAN